MNVPNRNTMPNHSMPAGKSIGVDDVCGPRTVRNVLSSRVVKTICHCTVAVEMNDPALLLRACQTVSANGESDGRVCRTKLTTLERTPAPGLRCPSGR